jgi:hypothetical protein
MPHIDSTEFGSITIDGQKYDQVLIVGREVRERDRAKLKELFGTTHKIGQWEVEDLLSNNPEVIIIGTGQEGALEVDDWVKNAINYSHIELIISQTPKAAETFNSLTLSGKAVNALIHTMC